jgi:hypothetical protein
MTTKLPFKSMAVLGLLLLTAGQVRALPVTSEFLVSMLGAAGREAVRDPYRGFAGAGDHGVSANPIARSVGFALPTLGFGGGGGGMSFGPIFGSSFPAVLPQVAPVSFSPPPRSGGVYFSFSDARPQQSNVVIGAVQVPEGGLTLLSFLLSLSGLVYFHRLRARKSL